MATVARLAGFFGALPFGFAPFFLAMEWKDTETPASIFLLVVLLGTLSLVPCAVALSRAGRDARFRTLILAIPAMSVGAYFLFVPPLGLFVFLGALLGLLLGLAALVPCWRRGDAQGRALALLGIAPALLLLELSAANAAWHLGDRDVEAAAPFRPSASLPPTGSGISPAAAPPTRDLSWLLRWEYLLAPVAVGLAVGALRLVRLRRQLARVDRPGGPDAATPRGANSPVREIPPLDVAHVDAGPLVRPRRGVGVPAEIRGESGKPMNDFEFRGPGEKAASAGAGRGPWRRMAYAAGYCGAYPFGGDVFLPYYLWSEWGNHRVPKSELLGWVLLGTLPLVPFAVAMFRVPGDAWRRVLPVVIVAILLGAISVVFFCIVVALYLAVGAVGLLLGLASVGPCWRRGDAEGRALALLGLAPALGVLGFVTVDRFRTPRMYTGHQSDLDLWLDLWLLRWENLLAMVAVGLAVGALRLFRLRRRLARATRTPGIDAADPASPREAGSLGRGISGPRLRSVRLYGGIVGGLVMVLVVSVRHVHIDWTQRGRWHELLEFLLLAAATSARAIAP